MNNRELESYLAKLDRLLSALPVSEKSEIILEIQSHVLDAMQADENLTCKDVIRDLGSAESVARRYLGDRGLDLPSSGHMVAPPRPSRRGISWGWGLVVVLAVMVSLPVIFFKSITPIVKVDDESGHVQILGGMIDVRDGGSHSKYRFGQKIEGRFEVEQGKELDLVFSNAEVEIEGTRSKFVSYECRSDRDVVQSESDQKVTLDFSDSERTHCEVSVPAGLKAMAKLQNGTVSLEELFSSLGVTLDNGHVEIEESHGQAYNYDLSAVNGHIDSFKSSTSKTAHLISVQLTNGMISKI